MRPVDALPTSLEELLSTHRRGFLRNAGLLAVSFSGWIPSAPAQSAATPQTPGPYPTPDFRQVDSWIVIHENNTATFYVGKTDPGQGTGTGFRQLMSDELDIAFEKTVCIMGSTDNTVDQIGSGGSMAMERYSWPMRRVAAEARRVLLEMAAVRLAVPVEQLAVHDAVITARNDTSETHNVWRTDPGGRSSTSHSPATASMRSLAEPEPNRCPNSTTRVNRRSATTFPARWTGL
ncbi:MAG: molybdopterin-dependent oxidoreductase [Paludibaculum sp.]